MSSEFIPKTIARRLGHEGQSLWRMLDGHDIPGALMTLAATSLPTSQAPTACEYIENDGYRRYMIKLGAYWHYAHSDGSSCYISLSHGFPAKDAQTAWLIHRHENQRQALHQRRIDVAALEDEIEKLEAQIAAAK